MEPVCDFHHGLLGLWAEDKSSRAMSNAFRILEFLEDIAPSGQCDDCLSVALQIEPRQTVNIVCRKLASEGQVERVSSRCAQCDKVKLINSFAAGKPLPAKGSAIDARASPTKSTAPPTAALTIDIERARTEVVRICRDLWAKHQNSDAPRGLAALIVELRNGDVVPTHIANMMLTLAGLRNVHVYENVALDQRALAIAVNAQSIIREWVETQENPR
jgi:hypothetical protein